MRRYATKKVSFVMATALLAKAGGRGQANLFSKYDTNS
jgi:hypothetical protein